MKTAHRCHPCASQQRPLGPPGQEDTNESKQENYNPRPQRNVPLWTLSVGFRRHNRLSATDYIRVILREIEPSLPPAPNAYCLSTWGDQTAPPGETIPSGPLEYESCKQAVNCALLHSRTDALPLATRHSTASSLETRRDWISTSHDIRFHLQHNRWPRASILVPHPADRVQQLRTRQ